MNKPKNGYLVKFGLNIKKIREGLNMSQDDVVANSYKLTKGTLSDIENGKRNLSFTTLIDLAKGLGKEPRELLDFKFDLDKE
jgi:transcriptional regulator with XRE-family HTH domain